MIITVDGPAGAGKSTVAQGLAQRLDLPYLNSGLIYRSVTVLVLDDGIDFSDRDRIRQTICQLKLEFSETASGTRVHAGTRDLTGRLRSPEVTSQVYRIANDPEYRQLLVEYQRHFAEPSGVVAEGRDMGTVIFPQANMKFYLDASAEERARRAFSDLQRAGHDKTYDEVLADLIERDGHDKNRDTAPLCVAPGAVVVDTDDLTVEQVIERLLNEVRTKNPDVKSMR